jgi:hypothetical protein
MKFNTILLSSYVFAAPIGFGGLGAKASSAGRGLNTAWVQTGKVAQNLVPTTRGGKILTYGTVAGVGAIGAAFGIKRLAAGPNVVGPDPNDPANQADLERIAQNSAPIPEDLAGVPAEGDLQDFSGDIPAEQVQETVAAPQTVLSGPGTNFASMI